MSRILFPRSAPMSRSLLRWPNSRHLALTAVALITLPLMGQPPGADRSKNEEIEPPVKNVVKNLSAAPAAAKPVVPDGGKRVLEFSTKRVVGASSSDATAAKSA